MKARSDIPTSPANNATCTLETANCCRTAPDSIINVGVAKVREKDSSMQSTSSSEPPTNQHGGGS